MEQKGTKVERLKIKLKKMKINKEDKEKGIETIRVKIELRKLI